MPGQIQGIAVQVSNARLFFKLGFFKGNSHGSFSTRVEDSASLRDADRNGNDTNVHFSHG